MKLDAVQSCGMLEDVVASVTYEDDEEEQTEANDKAAGVG